MIKEFKQFLKNTLKLISFNIRPLLLFVLAYTLASGMLVTTVTYYLSKLSLFVAGYSYLANDNYFSYLRSPFTWICFAIGMFAVGFIMMVEVSGVIYIYHASSCERHVGLTEVFYYAFMKSKRLIRVKNWPVLFYMVVMLPFTGMFSLTNVTFTVAFPGFILDYMMAKPLLKFAYLGFVLLLLVLTVRWMMSLHSFVLEESTFKEARKKSKELIKGHFFGAFITVLLTVFIIILAVVAAVCVAAGISAFIICVVKGEGSASFLDSLSIIWLFAAYIYMFAAPAITMAAISCYFYKICKLKNTEISVKSIEWNKNTKTRKSTIAFVSAFFCIIGGFYIYSHLTDASIRDSVVQRPEIVAHRGDSVRAPENTLPAFNLAMQEENVEWIELDLRQCKDGTIVVSHDDNLVGKIGETAYIHDLTYDELKTLDVGAWFSKKYEGTHLMTFDELLNLCKGKIKLQIEIKPTNYDNDFPQAVADKIREYDMTERVVVTSLSHDCLITLKKYAPEITTVYNMSAASGRIDEIEAVDWYSIEARNVTESLVRYIHAKDKKIYVWTINDSSEVQALIDMGVDGILSDDPVMLNTALNEADYVGGLGRVIRMMLQNPNFILQFGF